MLFFLHFLYAEKVCLPNHIKVLSFLEKNPQKRLSSYPFISGDTFRAFCDHIYDETRVPILLNEIEYGDTISVNRSYLNTFFKEVHPRIPVAYILVTHNYPEVSPDKFEHYLNDEKILAWFAENIGPVQHHKLYPLPLGLPNFYWPHGNYNKITHIRNEGISKDKLLYVNFLLNTHDSRTAVYNKFKNKPYAYVCGRKSYDAYLRDIARSKFVLSPRGNGPDCHRTWEAILLGSIPIIPRTSIDVLFEDLPVLIVDDWSTVTEDFLEKTWHEMQAKKYKMEKCMADYWLNRITKVQKKIRNELLK